MHVPEAYVGSEERLEVRIRERKLGKCRTFSRAVDCFSQGGLSTTGQCSRRRGRSAGRTSGCLQALGSIQGQAQMSTWLTAIVTNCARMQLRRRPRQTIFRSMSNLRANGNIPGQNDWRTVDQVLRMSVGSPNCVGVSCNSQRSFRHRCAKHSAA